MDIRNMTRRILMYPIRELYRILFPTQKNTICFESSPDYSDNSWALFQYMVKNGYNEKYRLCWIADKQNPEFRSQKNIVFVARSRYFSVVKQLYRSQYIFYTHGMTGLIRIRKDQTVVNLWHGCGYKASRNKDTYNSKFSLRRLLNSSKMNFNYVLVPGPVFIKTKSVFFNCREEQVLPIGYPRYDLLFSPCPRWPEIRKAWKLENRKCVIWMPTYRRTGNNMYRENSMQNQYWLPRTSYPIAR